MASNLTPEDLDRIEAGLAKSDRFRFVNTVVNNNYLAALLAAARREAVLRAMVHECGAVVEAYNGALPDEVANLLIKHINDALAHDGRSA